MQATDHLLLAAHWLRSVMLGSAATSIAVIAVAVLGFRLLDGRVQWRRGVGVVLGCFVLFGAPAIATALVRLGRSDNIVATPVPPPVAAATPAPRPSYDPYAGAALLQSR